MKSIRQAIIPAAGLGTRFLPATKVVPKELLPIFGRPALEYIVDELIAAGIEEIVFVLHPTKTSVLDHFSGGGFVENKIKEKHNNELLEKITRYQDRVKFTMAVQADPLGLGHSVWCAKDFIHDEFFVVALPDDLVDATITCTEQLIKNWQHEGLSTLALMEVPLSEVHRYGIVAPKEKKSLQSYVIETLVEKPEAAQAPSQLSVMGRYLLHKNIFQYIEETPKGALGEIQLTDALATLAQNPGLMGVCIEGKRLDVGEPVGFLEANLHYAQKSEFSEEIQKVINKYAE